MDTSVGIIFILIALASINVSEAVVKQATSCNIRVRDLNENQPLLLKKGKAETTFLYPVDKHGVVKVETGRKVLIACPGKGNYIKGLKPTTEILATCLANGLFGYEDHRFHVTSLACNYLPESVARRMNEKCYGNTGKVKIGFPLKSAFVHVMDICHNSQTMLTYWSRFLLTPHIKGSQKGFPRPKEWQIGDFYKNFKVAEHYKPYPQVDMIRTQTSVGGRAPKYVFPKAKLFLSRGHLTAKADFVYGAAQNATCWYINAAPQWHIFNDGNWNALEMSVRYFVSQRESDVEVYTGTYGHMSLKNEIGIDTPIYLYAKGNERRLPVPKFFWKIIYDPVSKKGTAFVGVNDPWAKINDKQNYICPTIAAKINWLNWDPQNTYHGLSYVCTVDGLRRSIPSIPNIVVRGLLV